MEFSTAGVVFIVYLMNQVDTWINVSSGIFVFLSILVPVLALATGFHCAIEEKDYKETMIYKNVGKIVAVFCILLFFKACTPNKDSVMQMGVAYGASEVIKSDAAAKVAQEISQISGKTAKVVNNKLDKMLEEK